MVITTRVNYKLGAYVYGIFVIMVICWSVDLANIKYPFLCFPQHPQSATCTFVAVLVLAP